MDPKAAAHLMSAFPAGNVDEQVPSDGINIRDYMATKAMQGLIVGVNDPNFSTIAEMAYEMADAMLKAREA
ncbi:MAG TPA: hypothetical protein VF783_13890 [Terriglobales bacterium]